MDFTIALKKREVEQAEALQARLLLQDISLYESEAAGAGPPVRVVEPVRLSAEIDSEVHHNDSSRCEFRGHAPGGLRRRVDVSR